MKQSAPLALELSRPLLVDKISAGGVEEIIVARPEEREALKKRFSLLELTKLEAHLNVDHVHAGKMLSVTGTMEADVVQQCVVTLEPVSEHIQETIDLLYAPPHLLEPGEVGTTRNEMADEETPEPIENGVIDLGELVSQQLGVSLNPYPRLPGAALPEGGKGEATTSSPFAELKKIKLKAKDDQL